MCYCHFQSTTGECLPLGKAINFKSLSFVDLLPISRLLPLLPSTCLFWNSTFLLACFEGMFPWLSCPFFSYPQSFVTVFLTPKRKKNVLCCCLPFQGTVTCYCIQSCIPHAVGFLSTHLISWCKIRKYLLQGQRQKFALSVAPKGVNLCDSKVADNVTPRLPSQSTSCFARPQLIGWPQNREARGSPANTFSHSPSIPWGFFCLILVWTFLNVELD